MEVNLNELTNQFKSSNSKVWISKISPQKQVFFSFFFWIFQWSHIITLILLLLAFVWFIFWLSEALLFVPRRAVTGKNRPEIGSWSYRDSRGMWSSRNTRDTLQWRLRLVEPCFIGWRRCRLRVDLKRSRWFYGWMVGRGAPPSHMGPPRK